MNRVVISLFIVLLTGCAAVDVDDARFFATKEAHLVAVPRTSIDGSSVEEMRVGVDTRDDILGELGAPMAKAPLHGEPQCEERWVYSRPSILGGDARMRVLLVDFDPQGRLCRTTFRAE